MPQQINLCTPILLTQKRYFSALAMVQALALFAMVGGGLAAYWVWSLKAASQDFRQTLAAHATEMTNLKAAIQTRKAVALPADPALVQLLQTRRLEEIRREKLLFELRRGLFLPGWGHSARLQMVAQSIPSQVWVTGIHADERQIDVSGFTLEPAALNEWVGKLADSPLLQGQKLATIKVERVAAEGQGSNGLVAIAAAGAAPVVVANASSTQRPVWSFNLVSGLATPVVNDGKVKP